MKIVEAAKRDLERYGHLVEEMDRTGHIDPAYRRPTVMQEARHLAEGQAESRTRVTCHLPVGNVGEERAFKKVIQYLRSLKDRHIGLSGYTFTDPSASQGFWWSQTEMEWIEDPIVLLMIDYKISLDNPKYSLADQIAELKQIIINSYKQYGSQQEEVWIVAQKLSRYA